MNDLFNTIKGIGELKYKNVYVFYDEPLMFSCYSATGGLYFILRLSCDDEQWLAVEVSKYRLELLECNDMEIRVPFVNPENGYLYRLYNNNLEFLAHNQLTGDMLPYSGEYLDYDSRKICKNIFNIFLKSGIDKKKAQEKTKEIFAKIVKIQPEYDK